MQTVLRAPVTTPLRDWLRATSPVAGWFGLDATLGVPSIYAMLAAGGIPPASAVLPALLLAKVGGGDDETAFDFPMVQFDIWGTSAAQVETIAADLHELDRKSVV